MNKKLNLILGSIANSLSSKKPLIGNGLIICKMPSVTNVRYIISKYDLAESDTFITNIKNSKIVNRTIYSVILRYIEKIVNTLDNTNELPEVLKGVIINEKDVDDNIDNLFNSRFIMTSTVITKNDKGSDEQVKATSEQTVYIDSMFEVIRINSNTLIIETSITKPHKKSNKGKAR